MNYEEILPIPGNNDVPQKATTHAKGSPTKIHNKLKPANNNAKRRALRSHVNINFELKESDRVYFDNFKENDPNAQNISAKPLEELLNSNQNIYQQ